MTGIAELFAELSGGDEFEQQWQLELWSYGLGRTREAQRDRKRDERPPAKQVHHCRVCGGEGHRGMWRGKVICTQGERMAA